jgi:AraC-like DNA-binding protein
LPCLVRFARVPGVDRVVAWHPSVPGIAEVLHATFREHRYPPHVHDTWTVLLLERGAVDYDLDGRGRSADPAEVTLLPPGVVHDGRPATTGGFRKQVLYVEPAFLPERLVGAAVDEPSHRRPVVRHTAYRLHRLLRDGDDAVAGEFAFAVLVEELLHGLGSPPERPPPSPVVADRLRGYLDADGLVGTTLGAAAAAIGASPGHAARSFTRSFGLTPHQYIVSRRIDAARQLLLEGLPIALVASSAGFHDQAHLTRQFRRYVGTTPGRYRVR